MSLGRKILDHFFYTPTETMGEGYKLGVRAAREMGGGEGARLLGGLFGMVAGAVAGGARILNPVDAACSLGKSDEEIDKRAGALFDVYDNEL